MKYYQNQDPSYLLKITIVKIVMYIFSTFEEYNKHECVGNSKIDLLNYCYCYICSKYIRFYNYSKHTKNNQLHNFIYNRLRFCDNCKSSLNKWHINSIIYCAHIKSE